jgi:hypothetical protein
MVSSMLGRQKLSAANQLLNTVSQVAHHVTTFVVSLQLHHAQSVHNACL